MIMQQLLYASVPNWHGKDMNKPKSSYINVLHALTVVDASIPPPYHRVTGKVCTWLHDCHVYSSYQFSR